MEVGRVLSLFSRYAVSEGIRFRYEDFGGIVYKRKTDQLLFLNSPLAVDLLSHAERGTVQEIITELSNSSSRGNTASPEIESTVLKILSSFEENGLIYELTG